MFHSKITFTALCSVFIFGLSSFSNRTMASSEEKTYTLSIKDHRFTPSEIQVEAGESFWLEIKNEDVTTEEFESSSLNLEKIIPPRRTVKIRVKNIKEGAHDIFGEFHKDSCKGSLLALKKESTQEME